MSIATSGLSAKACINAARRNHASQHLPDCWLKQRPREFTLSFNPRREICNSCGQLDFERFYVCEKPPKKNVEKTA